MSQHALPTHLRLATEHDCNDIYHIHRFAIHQTCSQVYDEHIIHTWLNHLHPDVYLDSIHHPNKTLWVAEFHRKVQGFFQLDFQKAQLDALYVHPFHHQKGLGTAMLYRAETLIQSAKRPTLSLFASKNSISFYQLNHYQTLEKAVIVINNSPIPCRLMRKTL